MGTDNDLDASYFHSDPTYKASDVERSRGVKEWSANPDNQPECYKQAKILCEQIEASLSDLEPLSSEIESKAQKAAGSMLAGLKQAIQKWDADIFTHLKVTPKDKDGSVLDCSLCEHSTSIIKNDCFKKCMNAVNTYKKLMLEGKELSKLEKFVNAICDLVGCKKYAEQKKTLMGQRDALAQEVDTEKFKTKPSSTG